MKLPKILHILLLLAATEIKGTLPVIRTRIAQLKCFLKSHRPHREVMSIHRNKIVHGADDHVVVEYHCTHCDINFLKTEKFKDVKLSETTN